MTKIARLFTVDVNIYEKARRKGINMSDAAEAGLEAALNLEEKRAGIEKGRSNYTEAMQKLLDDITDEDMKACLSAISRGEQFTVGWQRIFKNRYNRTISRAEILRVFGKDDGKDEAGNKV